MLGLSLSWGQVGDESAGFVFELGTDGDESAGFVFELGTGGEKGKRLAAEVFSERWKETNRKELSLRWGQVERWKTGCRSAL